MANLNIGHIKGDAGQGVPTGGTSGQFLAKNSSSDYDMSWVNPPNGAFNPFPVEEIYATGSNPATSYYIDKNGNKTMLTVSGGIIYLPAGIFDDGELHQIKLNFYNPSSTGYQMTLRYNGTIKVNQSRWYYHSSSSSSFVISSSTETWTPTTNIFSYINTYANDRGFMWVQKTT